MTKLSISKRSAEEDNIGLVLSGGGAKGAYQAGVWKAMAEFGLVERVRAISGTSIGAINAAAFAVLRDPAAIERFWMKGVGDAVDIQRRPLSEKSIEETVARFESGASFPMPSWLDRSGLERMLRRMMPVTWPADGPEVWATALECRNEWFRRTYALRRFRVDLEPDPEKRLNILLASAAIPWGFKPVKIDDVTFVDGGWEAKGGDNTPIAPFLEGHENLRVIVVVRLNSEAADPTPRPLLSAARQKVVEIHPSKTLPGPLDLIGAAFGRKWSRWTQAIRQWSGVVAFHPEYAKESFNLGYEDALHAKELSLLA